MDVQHAIAEVFDPQVNHELLHPTVHNAFPALRT